MDNQGQTIQWPKEKVKTTNNDLQELPTLPEHISSPPVFSGVSVTRSLVLCVCIVDSCLPFCTFSFDHCFVCSSSIYGFWLPHWYLQTLPAKHYAENSRSRNTNVTKNPKWNMELCLLAKQKHNTISFKI